MSISTKHFPSTRQDVTLLLDVTRVLLWTFRAERSHRHCLRPPYLVLLLKIQIQGFLKCLIRNLFTANELQYLTVKIFVNENLPEHDRNTHRFHNDFLSSLRSIRYILSNLKLFTTIHCTSRNTL